VTSLHDENEAVALAVKAPPQQDDTVPTDAAAPRAEAASAVAAEGGVSPEAASVVPAGEEKILQPHDAPPATPGRSHAADLRVGDELFCLDLGGREASAVVKELRSGWALVRLDDGRVWPVRKLLIREGVWRHEAVDYPPGFRGLDDNGDELPREGELANAAAPEAAPEPSTPECSPLPHGHRLCRCVGTAVIADGRTHPEGSVAAFSAGDIASLPGVLVPLE